MKPRYPVAGREVDSRAQAARREFRIFLALIWRHLGLPAPTPVQLDIARFLHRGPRRRLVLAFRGVGKSWIFSAYIAWRLWRRPDAKILIVSATQSAAESVAQFSRRLIRETPLLAVLRPSAGQRDTAALFDVGLARAAKDPSVKALGVGGQLTGTRADEILGDDVEALNNSATAAARSRLAEQVREFDAVLKPGGRITFLGTPQGPETLYALLQARGYRARFWPAEAPADIAPYGDALAPAAQDALRGGVAPGSPLDPLRFDAEDLAARRLSYGTVGYARQFLLDLRPVEVGRRPLALSDLIVTPLGSDRGPVDLTWDPSDAYMLTDLPVRGMPDDIYRAPASVSLETAPYDDALLAIDPSGRGRDETGFALLKTLHGRLFLLDAGGLEGGYDDEVLSNLADVAARHNVRRVLVEANFGDGMFGRLLAPFLRRAGVRATVTDRSAHGAKEARIVAILEPVLAQHRLIVAPSVIRRDAAETEEAQHRSLFWQIARLEARRGALQSDDRVDALALGVAGLADAMALDAKEAEARRQAAKARAEGQALLKAMSGRSSSRLWGGGDRKR